MLDWIDRLVRARPGLRLPEVARTDDIEAFTSETSAVLEATAPRNEYMIFYACVGIVVMAFLFMGFARLDRVVTGTGKITSIKGTLFVEPLQSGLIKDILVKSGEVVRKGQVLATLDPTFAHANFLQAQQKAASDRAHLARLQAELANTPYVAVAGDSYSAVQFNIWQQRQAQLTSALANFDGQISSYQAQIAALRNDRDGYKKRLEVASQLETMNVTLEQQGWGSRVRTLAATDNRVEIERQLASTEGNINSVSHQVEALKAQRAAYSQQWHSDTGKELSDTQEDLDKVTQDLKTASKLDQLSELRAPADAIVLKIGKVSTGSVTNPSSDNSQDPLFTLVPLSSHLEADIDVPAGDIGFIRVGDPVQIKLDAYRYMEHGTAKGTVRTISEGSFDIDEATNQPKPAYFKVRVQIVNATLKDVPSSFRLIPGMTLQGDIVVGHRTILSYILEGALRNGTEAMREP